MIILLIQCKPQETVAPVYYEIIPQFTTVEKLGTLKPGHSKATVMSKLGVAPWDVYSLTENGCQTFVYKYKKLKFSAQYLRQIEPLTEVLRHPKVDVALKCKLK